MARYKLSAAAMDFFRKEGSRGGKTRSKKLTQEQRREIARAGAIARWSKVKKSK